MASRRGKFWTEQEIDLVANDLARDASLFVIGHVLQSIAVDYAKATPTTESVSKRLEKRLSRERNKPKVTSANVKYNIPYDGMTTQTSNREQSIDSLARFVARNRACFALSRYLVGSRKANEIRGKGAHFRILKKSIWTNDGQSLQSERLGKVRSQAMKMSKEKINNVRIRLVGGYWRFDTSLKYMEFAYKKNNLNVESRIYDVHVPRALRNWAKYVSKRKGEYLG